MVIMIYLWLWLVLIWMTILWFLKIDGSEIVVESDNHKMPLNGKNDVF